ncbi:MAG TPA: TonB-dependent receptor plug domain-containing protein, partial [Sphingomonas sp.]|nr:TonB-dependent receptor plug domain-containing protein [Sphingomonas sp.]
DEIIVTAERRQQSVQTIPIAVSAISGAALAKDNVVQVNDLQRVTPSLTVQDAGITKFINIRGVGLNGSAPGLSSGVSYHIDGLFTRELGLSTPYYDIERIEVLRGPQGTLAGQNATGGAIFVVTKTPDLGEVSGAGAISYASYDHVTADAALNLPAGEMVALRVAGYYESRDSFFDNYLTGSTTKSNFQPGNLERFALRGSLLFKPTDTLSVMLRGEHVDQKSDGFAQRNLALNPTQPWRLNYNTPSRANITSTRVSGEIKWDIADAVQLRSLTGFQKYKLDIIYATDGAPATALPSAHNISQPVFSQEFNLVSINKSPFQ